MNNRHTQKTYWDMLFRAEYYRWQALRGSPLPGNDPVTGLRRNHLYFSSRSESREAYKAMARYALNQAKKYREENNLIS